MCASKSRKGVRFLKFQWEWANGRNLYNYGSGFVRVFHKNAFAFLYILQIFDGAIILASFALDLVFMKGLSKAQGEEAAALLIVFLLWRILRVINGTTTTRWGTERWCHVSRVLHHVGF